MSEKTRVKPERVKNPSKNEYGLTPKQETFSQQVASGKSQADAYREAYPKSRKWTGKALYTRAGRLAAKAEVVRRVAALRLPTERRARYALEDAMLEAEEARAHAAADPKGAAAMVAATALKAKLNGLMVEERKNERRPLEDIDDAELDARIKRDADEAGVALH